MLPQYTAGLHWPCPDLVFWLATTCAGRCPTRRLICHAASLSAGLRLPSPDLVSWLATNSAGPSQTRSWMPCCPAPLRATRCCPSRPGEQWM